MPVGSKVTRHRSVTNVEWAVYELDSQGDPTGGYWPAKSRSEARVLRDEMNANPDSTSEYGVFRRLVAVTRD